MIRRLIKNKGRLACVAAVLLAAALSGCVAEHEFGPETGDSREAAFTVLVPGMEVPLTRALDAAKEQEISEIDVVIFNTIDRTLAEYHRVPTADIGPTTGGCQFKIRGIATTSNITAVIIANASLEVAEALAAVTDNGTYLGASKIDFLETLEVTVGTKWNTSQTGYWKIPMYGEAIISGSIYSGTLPEVDLTRMLAKVNIENKIAPGGLIEAGDFRLTAVHVVNYNTRGRIAPTWNYSNGDIQPTTPPTSNLPYNPGKCTWSDGNELTYTLTQYQVSLEEEIYLFEAAAMPENTTSPNGLRLVFEGDYYTSQNDSEHYFYPVDFTSPDGKYIPVLRNHCYQFTITEAAGPGYDLLGEAVDAFGVMSNLRTRVLIVDESGIRNIVWNGQYFLGLEDEEVTLGATPGSTASVKCVTNYAPGWEVTQIEYVDGSGWLSATPASPGNPESDIELEILKANSSGFDLTAIVHIKAGRLTHTLTVTQSQFEGSFVGRFGGALKPDANGVWQYEKILYIQDQDESSGSRWKGSSSTTSYTASDWDGRSNTWAMTSIPALRNVHPAAKLCYDKSGEPTSLSGLTWFLPAQKQLMAVWVSRNSYNNSYSLEQVPYWSSTEYDETHPWNVIFSTGSANYERGKTSSLRVRCVTEF